MHKPPRHTQQEQTAHKQQPSSTPADLVLNAKNAGCAAPGEKNSNESNNPPSRLRWWNKWMEPITIITFMIFLATAAYVFFARRQWVAIDRQLTVMKGQLDETQKEFGATHRPWVGMVQAAHVTEPLTFDSTGAHLETTFLIKNGGNFPAQRVSTTLLLVVATYHTMIPDINSVIHEWCSPSVVSQYLNAGVGIPLLLPGDTFASEIPTRAEMRRKDFRISPSDRLVEAWIVFSIIYRDDLERPHCSALVQAYQADDGRKVFDANGIIKGHLTQAGFGQAY